jgi:hypothetical protein
MTRFLNTAMTGCAMIFMMTAVPLVWAADGEAPPPGGPSAAGPRGPKGPGAGQGPEKMKQWVEQNLPGAKEEFARHEAAMKAIGEKAKALGEEIKAAVQAATTPEARREVVKSYDPKIRAIAGEMVDEKLAFDQKMLDLRKANREQAVDGMFKMIMLKAAVDKAKENGKGGDLKEKAKDKREERREAREERREKRGQDEGSQPTPPAQTPQPKAGQGDAPPASGGNQPPPPGGGTPDEQIANEIAAALEKALQ